MRQLRGTPPVWGLEKPPHIVTKGCEQMNIVIYGHYSSHSQTEQSIEGQLQTCYEYAKQNGHTVVGEYIDRAQSGTTDSRVEFQRMITDSDKHTFEDSFGRLPKQRVPSFPMTLS